MKITINTNSIGGKTILAAFCFIYLLCAIFEIFDKIPEMMTVFVLGMGSLYIAYSLKRESSSNQLFVILFMGYILRIICLFLDLYGRGVVRIIHSGSDSEKFYRISKQYYNNDYSVYVTNYPYLLRWIYAVFGENRLLAQYVNVVCWFLTVIIIIRACELFKVKKKKRIIPYLLLAFWPNWVFLSSILLRESIQIFFDTLSFYYFIRWMRLGRRKDWILAFLAVLPAVYLHMASMAVWVAYIAILSVWNQKRRKIEIRFDKLVKMLLLFSIMIAAFYRIPFLMESFMSKVEKFSLYDITHRPFLTGGSDYLSDMDCQYWSQLIPFTMIRMFCFVFSPLPQDFRGAGDAIVFLVDSVSVFFMAGKMLWNLKRSENSSYIFTGIITCIMVVGIFAWGTGNAGTAMRHRTMLAGIWIMTYCFGNGTLERNSGGDQMV